MPTIKTEEPDLITIDLTGEENDVEDYHHDYFHHDYHHGLCRLCCEDPEEPVATLCGHIFCLDCLLTALEEFPLCPMCFGSGHFIRIYLA